MSNDQIIYKYRTWSNEYHRNTLEKNELYFASPSEINDPFDFKAITDFSLLNSTEKKETFINKVIDSAKQISNIQINEPEAKAELLSKLSLNLEKYQAGFNQTNFEYIDNRFGVISFSFIWNSILMWSHYSENHKGFCIGFRRHELEALGNGGTYGPVHYIKKMTRIDPLETNIIKEIFQRTHNKTDIWKYEKEYRITQLWTDSNPKREERILKFHDNCMAEIILGLNVIDSDKKKIIEIAKAKKVKVYQLYKNEELYLLEKREIN